MAIYGALSAIGGRHFLAPRSGAGVGVGMFLVLWFMVSWLQGFMVLCFSGFMFYGFMRVWLYGFMVLRLLGFKDLQNVHFLFFDGY